MALKDGLNLSSGLRHASRMTNAQRRQRYLCSPASCRPRVQRRELAWPPRWRRSERLPRLSTITSEALRTGLRSARCPQARPRPAGPCNPGRRRAPGRRKEQRRIGEFQPAAFLERRCAAAAAAWRLLLWASGSCGGLQITPVALIELSGCTPPMGAHGQARRGRFGGGRNPA